MYCIVPDVHKRKISYSVKDSGGKVYSEGSLTATRLDLDVWMKTLQQPWSAAMEATMFTGWIYDHLKPYAAALKVAPPLMLRAIAAKKKNDRIVARRESSCPLDKDLSWKPGNRKLAHYPLWGRSLPLPAYLGLPKQVVRGIPLLAPKPTADDPPSPAYT